MKKHIILSVIDPTNADFVINHWLKSLRKNVDLTNIDVGLISYALNDVLKKQLIDSGILVFPRKRSKHVYTSRFMDAAGILPKYPYDQILFVDSSDLIFQKDISHLFKQHPQMFRAVPQEIEGMPYEVFFVDSFTKKNQKNIHHFLKDKTIYNVGFILSPRKKFISLCNEMRSLVTDRATYGPDTIVINYIFHRDGVIPLDTTYNFNINIVRDGFYLKNGLFYTKNNKLIHVVHNAGRIRVWRPIYFFGYGKGFNYTNYIFYYLKRGIYGAVHFVKRIVPHYFKQSS